MIAHPPHSLSTQNTVVAEDADLPATLKRNLTQLRELDRDSQDLFEKMQKLSKNHILRAKKAIQEGRDPDEEFLVKARRAYKELVEIDESKVTLADQMHAEVAKHFDYCSSELRKFEEELKEKGQLKTPQMKTQQMMPKNDSQDSLGVSPDAAAASLMAGGSGGLPPIAGRKVSGSGGGPSGSEPPLVGQKSSGGQRGRGRKVSFKEAERQRSLQEAQEQRQAAAVERAMPAPPMMPSPLMGDQGLGGMGMGMSSALPMNYPDAVLPLAPREESNLPLCGAIQAAVDYIIPDNSKVCAKPPSTKMQPQDWILGTVLKYVPASNKYIILDEDDSDADPWAQEATSQKQHQVPARFVLPLPQSEPSVYTQYNEFPRGMWVLALYPDTTCFYKALVHTTPSMQMAQLPPRDYLVEFEDEEAATGKSEPMRVPQKFVVKMDAGR